MKTTGLYIASVTSLGTGKFKLNDCWIQSRYSELRVNDTVTDTAGKQFLITDYQNAPQRASENLWIEVEWPDYPNTDVSPLDNSATQDYDSQIGSLVESGYTPEISYLCRIANSANSYPAYHYTVVLTDARTGDPGAQLGAVGDYIIDKTGQIFEIVEWNGWEQTTRIRDVEERPHASDGSTLPVAGEYAFLYRSTADGMVAPQADFSILGEEAQDDAINFSNTSIWKHRGIAVSDSVLDLENVTKIALGAGLSLEETTISGWVGGKTINLNTTTTIEGSFSTAARTTFEATEGQAIFVIDYEPGFLDIFMNGFRLVRNQDFYANDGIRFVLDSTANAGDILDVVSYDTFNIANHYTISQSDMNYVNTTGNTTIDGELTANAFNLTSARVFKENIEEFDADSLAIINRIDVKTFNYKDDESKLLRVGFIADDTQEILSGPDRDYFDMGNTVGILLKAVQEMSAKIEELEDKLDGQ